MKTRIILLIGLALAVAVVATSLTLAMGGDETATPRQGVTGGMDEPSGEGHNQYEITVKFNTSVTQEDMKEAEAILRAFDDGLDLLIMYSFPPSGRALLETNASDFCPTVEEQLGAKSYVDGVLCQPWQESGDVGPDIPVASTDAPVVETSPTPVPSPTAATTPGREPQQALSVSELLANPVYDEEVKVYGEVSLLGELFCPCFALTSDGETLNVWYDLMVEDDGTHRPSVSVEGIENGDWVFVTGELKIKGMQTSPNEFWAKTIEKLE